MKTVAALAVTTLAIAGLGTAGSADFEDAKASEAAYCERVIEGTHTDYLQLGGVCHDGD
jgi:hypothetical protein